MREWTTKHIEDLVKKTVKDMDIGSGDGMNLSRFYIGDVRASMNATSSSVDNNIRITFSKDQADIHISGPNKNIDTLEVFTNRYMPSGVDTEFYILAAFPRFYMYRTKDITEYEGFYVNNDAILNDSVVIPKDDLQWFTLKSVRESSAKSDIYYSHIGSIYDDPIKLTLPHYYRLNVLLLKKTSAVVNNNYNHLDLSNILYKGA